RVHAGMSGLSVASRRLDTLPRAVVGYGAPAFRTCGVVGLYLALVTLLAGGLLAGRSLVVVAALAAVCCGSFFGYALLRRRLTGAENLVLLEHVWIALACAAATLAALREP